jgi:hypothetical protein
VKVEIARLLARVGDGHTGYFIPWDRASTTRVFPIEIWMGKDGPIVIAAAREHASLVGARIVRMGGRPVAEVVDAIRPLLSLDSPYGANGLLPGYMVVPELLQALGVTRNADRIELELDAASGSRVRATLRAQPSTVEVVPPPDAPRWMARREEPYWLDRLDDGTLFVQYNDASFEKKDEPFSNFCSRLEWAAREKPFDRLVVDLRWNDGGSVRRARSLLHSLIRLADVLPEGKLFVVTSPRTFSAAALFAVDVDQHTAALFVGEPAAGRPNGYGELRRFRLPVSGLEIRYSAWYYQQSTPDDLRPAIFPDLEAPLTAEDFRSGADPALRAIVSYRDRTPISVVVRKRLSESGIADAIREYRTLKQTRYNEFVFGERELDTAGRSLADSGQLDAAIALLEVNRAEFPWSAQSRQSLGDALAKAGRCDEARREYQAAFDLDRSFSLPQDRLARLKLCGLGGN